MNAQFSFKINDNDFFLLSTEEETNIHGCDDATIELILNNKKYLLFNREISDALFCFRTLLKEAIDYDLYLHPTIDKDIGFIWNEYKRFITDETIADAINIVSEKYEIEPENKSWVGYYHLLWSSHEYDTWLYNKNRSIIIEITPRYPWFYVDPKPEEQFIEYHDFIKNYRPVMFLEISKETAQQWLFKVNELLQKIADYDEKMRLLHANESE